MIAASNVGIVLSGVYPQVRPFSQCLFGVAIPLILAAGLSRGRRWAVVGMQVMLSLISLTAVLALVGGPKPALGVLAAAIAVGCAALVVLLARSTRSPRAV